MVTASEDATAQLWDVASHAPLTTLVGYTATIISAAFSPNGEWLVTGGEPHNVTIWEYGKPDPGLDGPYGYSPVCAL